MTKIRLLLLLLSGVLVPTSHADAATLEVAALRVGIWNISNFVGKPGVAAFGVVGTGRNSSQLNGVRGLIHGSKVDVWLLQEIVDLPSLIWLAGDGYFPIMSPRISDRTRKTDPDRFTAALIRSEARESVTGVLDVRSSSLIMEGGKNTYTRNGTAVGLRLGGVHVLLVSVHLKSGCSRSVRLGSESCSFYVQEMNKINAFVEDEIDNYDLIVVAGDFNRAFHLVSDAASKRLMDKLSSVSHGSSVVGRYPVDPIECRARLTNEPLHIDYFIIGGRKANLITEASVSSIETRNGHFYDGSLSDHCALVLDLRFQ